MRNKMDIPDTTPLVDIQKAAIDHVNVIGPTKSLSAQMWIALTPLLTVLITAVGIVFTVCFNIYQTKERSQQKADSDWRSALEKVYLDQSSSAIGTFEMQSFLSDPSHRDQARSIASAILRAVENRAEPFGLSVMMRFAIGGATVQLAHQPLLSLVLREG
jgi:hypothetical protein